MAQVFGTADGNGNTMRHWEVSQDEIGHRDYIAIVQVMALSHEGPAAVLTAAGLPVPGSTWQFDGDSDVFAYCKTVKECKQRVEVEGEHCLIWDVTLHFTSRPDLSKCEVGPFDSPLTQCPKISGHSVRKTREGVTQADGISPIINSAYEQIRGPNNEWDYSHSGVKIEMNVGSFFFVTTAIGLVDYVNTQLMWGFPSRCVKLSNVTWEKKFYGGASGTCNVYWTLVMDFEIQQIDPAATESVGVLGPLGGWDRLVIDEGTKVLNGHWNQTTGQWIIDPKAGLQNPPVAPSFEVVLPTTGTNLPNGTWTYVVTAIDASNKETGVSPVATVVISMATNGAIVTLTWPIVPGAVGYNVYRVNQFLTSVQEPTLIDNGISAQPIAPPTVNQSAIFPSAKNPSDFIQFKDRKENPCKVILNGAGLPSDVFVHQGPGTGTGSTSGPGHIPVQFYQEVNFLAALSVPSDISSICVTFSPVGG
jgi:hypothetical protein